MGSVVEAEGKSTDPSTGACVLRLPIHYLHLTAAAFTSKTRIDSWSDHDHGSVDQCLFNRACLSSDCNARIAIWRRGLFAVHSLYLLSGRMVCEAKRACLRSILGRIRLCRLGRTLGPGPGVERLWNSGYTTVLGCVSSMMRSSASPYVASKRAGLAD